MQIPFSLSLQWKFFISAHLLSLSYGDMTNQSLPEKQLLYESRLFIPRSTRRLLLVRSVFPILTPKTYLPYSGVTVLYPRLSSGPFCDLYTSVSSDLEWEVLDLWVRHGLGKFPTDTENIPRVSFVPPPIFHTDTRSGLYAHRAHSSRHLQNLWKTRHN